MRTGLNRRVDELEASAGMGGRVLLGLRWRGAVVGVPDGLTERDTVYVLNFRGLNEATDAG